MTKPSDTSDSDAAPVRLGIAGAGGYAATIRDLVRAHGGSTRPGVALHAVCDPDEATHAQAFDELRRSGVAVSDSFDDLLATPGLDAVWLPVPIPLHRPFTEKALAAGKAVMVEKPVAASIDDVLAMMAAQEVAQRPVAVGFQDVYDPTTLPLKRRLLGGDIGRVRRASVWGCWPRDTVYYGRNTWAGRIRLRRTDGGEGPLVLDSPINNAMAHFVNIALFLLGPDDASVAVPEALEGELYRAAAIENYDTVAARVRLQSGVPLTVLLTHACATTHHPVLRIEGERGTVTWTMDDIVVRTDAGETRTPRGEHRRTSMLGRFARLVRGIDAPDVAVATLASALPHARIVSALSASVPIQPVPAAAVDEIDSRDGGRIRAVPGIEAVFHAAAAAGHLLHETGRLPFTQPPIRVELAGYNHFVGVAAATDLGPIAAEG